MMPSNLLPSEGSRVSPWRTSNGRSDYPIVPTFRRRVSLVEFDSAPEGFVSLSSFLRDNFKDSDRPALSKIRQTKADHRFKLDGCLTPAYLRMKKGWSQTKLAKKLETSQSAVARLEAGLEKPSFDKLIKLQAVLDVQYDQLIEAISNVPIKT